MKKLMLISLFMLLQAETQADVSVQAVAFSCQTCHGESLAVQSKSKIMQNLLAFKYQQKTATIMQRISKGYSDAELTKISAYMGK